MFLLNRVMPVFAFMFFVFILWIIVVSDSGSSNVAIDMVRAIPYGDKIGHVSLYAMLAALVNLSIKPGSKKHLGLPLGCALVLAFALLEELSQGFFPSTRTLDAEDAIADFIGIYLAAWVTTRKWMF